MRKLSFLFYFLLTVLMGDQFLYGNFTETDLQDYLLPKDHPLQKKLKGLFVKQNIFKNRDHFRKAGFDVLKRVHRSLMVARHPQIKNYLFKKMEESISRKEELKNFLRRIHGARALRTFIKSNHLQHIVVPKKWLYPLPKKYTEKKTKQRSYILIVEDMNIYKSGKHGSAVEKYYSINKEMLRELCQVVYHFRGLDSVLSNLPFTHSNKIAFIDTERWELQRDIYLRHIMPLLSKDRQEFAVQAFRELEESL